MPALRHTSSTATALLDLMQNEGNLLLAEPRLLHRRCPPVSQWPNLPGFSHSKRSSFRGAGHAATSIVTVFLCSVERGFSVPAVFVSAVAQPGQAWPKAIGGAGAQRA